MKYIITDKNEVVIGNDKKYHMDLAKHAKGNVVSAGYVKFKGTEAIVFGESIGYGIKSRPEDGKAIDRLKSYTTFV